MKKTDDYVLQRAWKGWGIHTFIFDEKNDLKATSCGKAIRPAKEVERSLRLLCSGSRMPVLCFEEETYFYMGFVHAGDFYILGPVSWKRVSLEEERKYCFRKKLGSGVKIACLPVQIAVSAVSTVCALVTGSFFSEEEIIKNAGAVSELPVEDAELYRFLEEKDGYKYFDYEAVHNYMSILQSGNMHISETDFIQQSWQVELIGDYAPRNEKKKYEYMILQAFVLARQAGINCGVPERICFDRMNQYIGMLAECTTVPEMVHVYAQGINHMETLICGEREKKHRGDLIEQCKSFIAHHIRTKITLSDIAESVNRNPSYLSRVFAEQEGISLMQYIRREKLRVAANLIRNSNESMGKIAEYLSFGSQSSFAKQFGEEYSMSPVEYRKRNKLNQ